MSEFDRVINIEAFGQGPYDKETVEEMLQPLLQKVAEYDSIPEDIAQNLQDLHGIIEKTKREISSARASDIQSKFIPEATDELDAVVGATEEATGQIMDACEKIQSLIGSADQDVQQQVNEETIKIFEACSFQDITGQRITKVVQTLKDIEIKVEQIMDALPGHVDLPQEDNKGACHVSETQVLSDEDLLNGPQLPPDAPTQDDIDRLFSES